MNMNKDPPIVKTFSYFIKNMGDSLSVKKLKGEIVNDD